MENDIVNSMVDSFKGAVEAVNYASLAVSGFYNRVKECNEKMRGILGEAVRAYEEDSDAKDRKHAEQKQKLDGIVADAEKRLEDAQKALSVAFVSEDEQKVKAAKKALSDAETDLNQARAARAVFDDAVGVQYDEALYNQIFSTEAELLEVWNRIVDYRNQVNDSTESAIKAMSKAKEAAKYTDFSGLFASKRTKLEDQFNHSGSNRHESKGEGYRFVMSMNRCRNPTYSEE